jgi:hypothetical protein
MAMSMRTSRSLIGNRPRHGSTEMTDGVRWVHSSGRRTPIISQLRTQPGAIHTPGPHASGAGHELNPAPLLIRDKATILTMTHEGFQAGLSFHPACEGGAGAVGAFLTPAAPVFRIRSASAPHRRAAGPPAPEALEKPGQASGECL